jgi:hypothetical protein
MCVWQSHAPAGIAKLTGVAGCEGSANVDPARFPWFDGRVYTPELASPEEMKALHQALHVQRVVIASRRASTAPITPRHFSA